MEISNGKWYVLYFHSQLHASFNISFTAEALQIKSTEERAWINAIRIEIGISCGLLFSTFISTLIVLWLSKSKNQEYEPKILMSKRDFSVSVIEEWDVTNEIEENELKVDELKS